MNFKLHLLLVIITFNYACQKDKEDFQKDCIHCMEYAYQQIYNDTLIDVNLQAGQYCVSDSIFQYVTNNNIQFLELLTDNLIDTLTQNGYCVFTSDSLITNHEY